MARLLQLDPRPDLVERAHAALLDAIVDGTLAPGARLTQEDLARELAVSRQPVLQALRQLKADGLVIDAPGRGLQVAPLDAGAIDAVYQVRGALDRLAARLAAQRRVRLDADLLAAGRYAVRSRDVRAMIACDLAFHRAIYAACGNPLIESTAHVHWHHVRRAMGAVMQRAAIRETVWDEHAAIAQAIAAGDADAAERHIGGHDERAADFLRRQLAVPAQTEPSKETPDAIDPRATRPVRA